MSDQYKKSKDDSHIKTTYFDNQFWKLPEPYNIEELLKSENTEE